MDKIKDFFKNKIVKVVSWIVLALSSASLIVGGATAAEVSSGVELVGGIISAIALLVTFISSMIQKE